MALPSPLPVLPSSENRLTHSLTPDDGASNFALNPFCPISNFSGAHPSHPHPRRVASPAPRDIGAFYVIAIGKLVLPRKSAGTQAKLRLEI